MKKLSSKEDFDAMILKVHDIIALPTIALSLALLLAFLFLSGCSSTRDTLFKTDTTFSSTSPQKPEGGAVNAADGGS